MADLSAYEQERLDNMAENQRVLDELGLSSASTPKPMKPKNCRKCKARDNTRDGRQLRPRKENVAASSNTVEDGEGSEYDGDEEGDGESDGGDDDDAMEMHEEAEETEEMECSDEDGGDDSEDEDTLDAESEAGDELEADEEEAEPEQEQQEQQDEEASVPGGPTPRPSHVRQLVRKSHEMDAAPNLPYLVFATFGDNHLFILLRTHLPEERDRVALKCTSKQLSELIPAQVGLAEADLARLTTMLSRLELRLRVERASLSECIESEGLDSLRDGGATAGIALEHRGRAAQEKMLGRVESAKVVKSCLMDVCSDMGLGLIPIGKENAIAEQLLLAHNKRRITLEDKGGIASTDIYDLTKFGKGTDYPDLHELCQRVHGLTHAGQSRSSGGGAQIDKNRLHIRQPLEDGRTTPGERLNHLDEVSNLGVPLEVLELARSEPARYAFSIAT